MVVCIDSWCPDMENKANAIVMPVDNKIFSAFSS